MLVRTRPVPSRAFDRPVDRVFDQLTSSFVTSAPARRSSTPRGSTATSCSPSTCPARPPTPSTSTVAGRTLTVGRHRAAAVERSVRLGAALDPEQVSARYVDGRLTVTVAAGGRRRAPAHRGVDRCRGPVGDGDRGASAGERHQRPVIGQRRQLGRHRHEIARRQDDSSVSTPSRRPAASRASIAYGITSRSTPTEHTTSTGEPSARRPKAEHGRDLLMFGRGTGG